MNNNSNGAGGYYRTYDRFLDRYGPELDPISIAVYHYLVRCADKDGYCHPGYERIAYHCGRISRRSAVYAIAKLIKLGLIERRHRKRGNESHDTNKYKIRLEVFTDAPLRGGVVHHMHEGSAPGAPGVVHQMHPKDNTVEGQHNEGEREGEPPPSIPPNSLSVFSNSPQEGETSKVGGDVEAATAQSAGGDNGLSYQNQAVGIATRANGKPTTGRERQHQGNGAGKPLPADWALSADDIKAAVQETRWTEAEVKRVSGKFRDHHRSKDTLSHDWQAEWHLWLQREIEYVRANGKVERTAPRPPVFVAEPKAPIDPSKPRPSHKAAVLAEINRMAARP
jgi:hypothetical protein